MSVLNLKLDDAGMPVVTTTTGADILFCYQGGISKSMTVDNAAAYIAATATAALVYRPVNTQTNTTYTLVLGDNGKLVTISNASPIMLTIPTNASVAFPVGTEIALAQLGAGQITVTAAGGVTLNSYTSKVALAGQFADAKLKKTATNTWLLTGTLA